MTGIILSGMNAGISNSATVVTSALTGRMTITLGVDVVNIKRMLAICNGPADNSEIIGFFYDGSVSIIAGAEADIIQGIDSDGEYAAGSSLEVNYVEVISVEEVSDRTVITLEIDNKGGFPDAVFCSGYWHIWYWYN